MSLRIISVSIAMNAEVELFSSKDQTLIQRRKQHILSTAQLVHRDSEQSVVTPCIAGHDGRVAIRSSVVRRDDFTLKRILQIHKLGLVEFKKSHI